MEGRARLFPDSGARWIQVAGAFAMFDGVDSPCTQTFGLGVFQAATPADLDTIETFYREHAAPVFHEVSPLADASTVALLTQRGYHPVELSSVLYCAIGDVLARRPSNGGRVRARLIRHGEAELWADTATRGWSDIVPPETMGDLMRVSAARAGALPFLAELDGAPVAAGALSLSGGVALLAGASTVPEARRQGAQMALLEARLRYAADQGCDLAMICALPGSASQRNAERNGFRIAYTRIKWHLVSVSRTNATSGRERGRRPRNRSR